MNVLYMLEFEYHVFLPIFVCGGDYAVGRRTIQS